MGIVYIGTQVAGLIFWWGPKPRLYSNMFYRFNGFRHSLFKKYNTNSINWYKSGDLMFLRENSTRSRDFHSSRCFPGLSPPPWSPRTRLCSCRCYHSPGRPGPRWPSWCRFQTHGWTKTDILSSILASCNIAFFSLVKLKMVVALLEVTSFHWYYSLRPCFLVYGSNGFIPLTKSIRPQPKNAKPMRSKTDNAMITAWTSI